MDYRINEYNELSTAVLGFIEEIRDIIDNPEKYNNQKEELAEALYISDYYDELFFKFHVEEVYENYTDDNFIISPWGTPWGTCDENVVDLHNFITGFSKSKFLKDSAEYAVIDKNTSIGRDICRLFSKKNVYKLFHGDSRIIDPPDSKEKRGNNYD